MLDYSKSFIETQFPVSKISKESYKERKAGASQTLTGMGKWWGRKPLILVRATILGVLMPVSDKPDLDKSIFLKILTMDEEGLWLRKSKSIPISIIVDYLNDHEKIKYFEKYDIDEKASYKSDVTAIDKEYIQKLVFNRMSYDTKLTFCERPENVILQDTAQWDEINSHLETNAFSVEDLIKQLGIKRFGKTPRIGDCFAGGGSIPFEAGRMGADVYASDLNPIASLLSWSTLNLLISTNENVNILQKYQDDIFNAVEKLVNDLGIEKGEHGEKADIYLYCNEAVCPECSYKVPLLPNYLVGGSTGAVLSLIDNGKNGFDFIVKNNADKRSITLAKKQATFKNYALQCPHCENSTPIPSLRGDYDDGISREYRYNTPNKLRKWDSLDIANQSDDIFTERLYCIRYNKTEIVNGKEKKVKFYKSPSLHDLKNEKLVFDVLKEKQLEWREKGYIPSAQIVGGWNTNQPIYEKGWTHWSHLFNPRQQLLTAMFLEQIDKKAHSNKEYALGLLGVNKMFYYNSKLCLWDNGGEKGQQTFYNQALNTTVNYATRGLNQLKIAWNVELIPSETDKNVSNSVELRDARIIDTKSDIWITDPPYADAVHYHELTEFFLAWDKALIKKAFPEWYTDSKRVLAVQGIGKSFNDSMVEIYRNLANNMPDNGYQVVMFTHQDVKVWSELSMILWSAGLRVISAWNISTETESGGLKAGGNYVSGTVLLTLKKQDNNVIAFQDELYDEIKKEVKSIIDSMKDLDRNDDPDFSDADYLLASYASSLKVLTAYKEIDGINVEYWLSQPRDSEIENPVEALINKAVRIAYDYLIPTGFEKGHWADLKPEERFFIRGLEIEMNGSNKISSYQELARGFGVSEYQDMFANFKANQARLKTPSEYRMTQLGGDGFGKTLLRHLLVALNETVSNQSTEPGRAFLRDAYKEDNQYWYKKPLMIEILNFISKLEYVSNMEHWHEHAKYARILKESLKNEGV